MKINIFNKCAILGILGITLALLSACSKDEPPPKPAALTIFKPTVAVHKQWSNNISTNKTPYLKLAPAFANDKVFIASPSGKIKAIEKNTGKTAWQINTKMPITSGLAANSNMIFVGTGNGNVLALQQQNGKTAWQTTVPNDVLAAPAANDSVVVVKTSSGHISAFDTATGKSLWNYTPPESPLTLRGSSSPVIANGMVISGFANGEMAAIDLENGTLEWKQQIATPTGSFAVERMVDIVANPVVKDNIIYVATFQGSIAAINIKSGHIIWQQPMSCYSGIAVDEHNVYVTDTQDKVWALDRTNGSEMWHKETFANRSLSGPAVLNNLVAIGDAEGYVHWLDTTNGQIAARTAISGAIVASPITIDGAVYVFSSSGDLAKFSL